MYGQRSITVVQSAGVKESNDTGQESEIHKEGQQDTIYFPGLYPWSQQADIHGNAAELEREIPPVILSVIQMISKAPLFPDFAGKHQDAEAE